MTRIPFRSFSLSVLVLAALRLTGCHQDGSGQIGAPFPPPPRIPTDDQAQEIGDRINEHTQDALIAFNVSELLLFELPLRAFVGHAQTGWLDGPRARAGGCPTVDDDTDLDGDGIPDDATFTFAGAACTVVVDGVGTFQQSGSVHVVDAGVEPGYQLTWNDYRIRLDGVDGDVSVVAVSGTYDVVATSGSATLVESVVITTEEQTGGATATGTFPFDWTVEFVSDGGLVDLAIPLPSGMVTVGGPMGWTAGGSSFTFDAATTADLPFDAGCQNGPEFLGGEIRAEQRDGWGTLVDVRYVGCGEDPEVELVTEL